jgi:acetyl esterase/lipase
VTQAPTSPGIRALVDPEIAAALAALPLELGKLGPETLLEQRAMVAALLANAEPAAGVESVDHVVPGEPDVTLRVHRPRAGTNGPRPCIYWIHGGGLVMGDYRMSDPELTRWCASFDCVAVSVEYRLAPEHCYPAALDDCYSGLAWVLENAEELGVDQRRIGVGGGSAGGGLAAALALIARDRGEIAPAFQLLLAPMLDDRQQTASSRWEDAWTWPPSANRFGWQSYLGELYGGDVPEYAAAARARDLSGLPPTFIRVGSIDSFVDEDVLYAQRLIAAGVPTELHVYPGGPHGFETLAAGAVLAQRAKRDVDEWLRAMLA